MHQPMDAILVGAQPWHPSSFTRVETQLAQPQTFQGLTFIHRNHLGRQPQADLARLVLAALSPFEQACLRRGVSDVLDHVVEKGGAAAFLLNSSAEAFHDQSTPLQIPVGVLEIGREERSGLSRVAERQELATLAFEVAGFSFRCGELLIQRRDQNST